MPLHFNDLRHKIADAVLSVGFGLTPHEVCIGGPAGQLAQVPSLGAAGQRLTSNGPGADPSWQPGSIPGGGDRDVWLSGLGLPTGLGYTPLAETIPRPLCTDATSFTSGTGRIQAIFLPAGLTVSQMTMVVGQTAQAGGTHGWYALLDNTFKVLAVTADQTGATVWAPAGAIVTLAFGASIVTSYRGTYYVACSITSTTSPNIVAYAQGANGQALALAPQIGGLGALQNTPPAVGATYSISNVANVGLWATVG